MKLARDRDWRVRAACAGANPNLFVPIERLTTDGSAYYALPDAKQALSYCRECPVQAECAAFAAEMSDYAAVGVWGGRYRSQHEAEVERMAVKRRKEALS